MMGVVNMPEFCEEKKEGKVIRFYAKVVYGNTLFYPVDQVEAIRLLAGTKTITPKVFKGMELLGFKFVEVLASSVEDNIEQARRDA